jgi:hypothetical protein
MNYNVDYSDEHEVLYLKINGELSAAEIEELMPIIRKAFDGKEHRRMLIDVTNNPAKTLSKEVRDSFKNQDVSNFEKAAIIGASPVTHMISKVVLAIIGSKKSKFFKTETEALVWLKGEKS